MCPFVGNMPTNAELTALAISAAWAAYIIWTKKRDNTQWMPSAPFHWERKRAAMAELSASDIIVITDFDATITTGDSEQCHDLVGASKLLPEEFREEFCPLLDWTSNTQIDGVEWWDKAVRVCWRSTPPAPYSRQPTQPRPFERGS